MTELNDCLLLYFFIFRFRCTCIWFNSRSHSIEGHNFVNIFRLYYDLRWSSTIMRSKRIMLNYFDFAFARIRVVLILGSKWMKDFLFLFFWIDVLLVLLESSCCLKFSNRLGEVKILALPLLELCCFANFLGTWKSMSLELFDVCVASPRWT